MKTAILYSLLCLLLIGGCAPPKKATDNANNNIETLSSNNLINLTKKEPDIKLNHLSHSEFMQVNATFYVIQSKSTVFKTLSDLSLSKQWFDRLSKIETLSLTDNNNFVIRSVISPPWPFKNRELITCVNTQFTPRTTTININNCSDKLSKDPSLVRIKNAQSRWLLSQVHNAAETITKVQYQAWIEPEGYVPALFFNRSLKSSSFKSLTSLKALIENTNSNEGNNDY